MIAVMDAHFRIVLIGFSGTGKTYWSERLHRNLGYRHLCCDDLLEDELESVLPGGTPGMARVGSWMGLPWEDGFQERQAQLLAAEARVMQRILTDSGLPERTVIDTTGSVIYAEDAVLHRLCSFGTVVHLGVPSEALDEMFGRFSAGDRTLVWGNLFCQRGGETREQAVARCYRELLSHRHGRYERWADVTLDSRRLRDSGINTQEFLEEIRSCN